ncbi:hypothetical protein [Thiomicrospira cyclica]|jgi:hypothetical protein|uniref:Uncharacterized protein n=1 Tax=Thiomicrospira cyclica (strain DSM 14477 / JCM 11371 / ALM1) TaxID=717773 RepID=F6DC52_THICA|nr:hypothetical protein [Thiomicrospira cyclica]AEG31438.1 hypothetical protein Thicy_0666 [Thiomicrospira cyclica ALM1]
MSSHTPKPKFTWHYYMMGLGAFASLIAVSLLAWSALVSAVAFIIVAHPVLRLTGALRLVFLVVFAVMYVFSFPSIEVIQAQMMR